MDMALILKGLQAAVEVVNLYSRAAEAANNGDDQAAKDYLEQARSHYDEARAGWDDAS